MSGTFLRLHSENIFIAAHKKTQKIQHTSQPVTQCGQEHFKCPVLSGVKSPYMPWLRCKWCFNIAFVFYWSLEISLQKQTPPTDI